jgi:hypothetical protein
MAARSQPNRWYLWKTFLPAWLLLFLLSTVWALATPIFASPDENAHAVKAIAQAHGELLAHPRSDSRFPVYDLPADYRYSPGLVCFAFDSRVSASCKVELGASFGSTTFGDWVSSYNPVYYYAVGWPTRFLGSSTGIYAMRIVSALLSSALLAAACAAALAARRARWMPTALAFFAAPMSLFLMGSVNPQSMEFCAAALLTVSLLRLVEKVRKSDSVALGTPTLWVMTVVGASLLAIARATGPLWVLIVVVGVLLAAGWRDSLQIFRRRSSIPGIVVISAFGAFSLIWTLVTGTLSGQAQKADAPLVGASFGAGAWAMLRGTPGFIRSAIGIFGWQDTELPAVIYALCFGALAILLTLSVVGTGRRESVVVIAAAIVAVLVPVVVQAASVGRTGIIWQGRYGLFLYLGLILIAAWALSHSANRIAHLSARISLVVNGLMAAFGIAAFVVVLRRYVVGTDNTINKMLTAPEWQPPLGWPTLTALLVVLAGAFAVWNSMIAYSRARHEDEESVELETAVPSPR